MGIHHTTIGGTLLASMSSLAMSWGEDILRTAICTIVGGVGGYFVTKYLKKHFP